MGKYAQKHNGSGTVINEAVRHEFLRRGITDKLACAVAFHVSKVVGVLPLEVGQTADLMELRLVKCQLGLFGYSRKKSIVTPLPVVRADIKRAILDGLVENRLPCKEAWRIADTFGCHKLRIAAACDGLGIKIAPCQLGAF